MKKTGLRGLKRCAAVLLCGVAALRFIPASDTKTDASGAEGVADIWSTYSTYAVLQKPEEQKKNSYQPPKFDAELKISMAKGETEGGQIIFTAKKDISSFDFTVKDLKSGGNTISRENIAVYKQAYTYVEDSRTPMTTGWYPDMLLPIELAEKANETSVKAGNNQGITVEVTTTSDTVPGMYTGAFTLTIDGKETEIPVSVEVWDIDITESHTLTVDLAMIDKLAMGGDSSAESVVKYYDQLLDYRTNNIYMPFSTYSVDRFIEELLKYWDNPRVTYIGVPEQYRVFEQYVLEAARHSTPEMILTDKLYTYDKDNDEPTDYRKVVAALEAFQEQLQNVVDTLVEEEFFVPYDGKAEGGEFYQRLTQSVLNIDIVETAGWREEYDGYNIVYSPHSEFGSTATLTGEGGVNFEANRDVYEKKSHNGRYIHYINGTNPWLGSAHPNYLSNLRYWGYNMQAEGIQGELSWSIAEFALVQQGSSDKYVPRNHYESALSFTSLGLCLDGQYVYSGSRYGVTGFIPSMRLAVRRDGFEDYELIYKLSQLYTEELMREYGAEYDMRDVLDWVYRKAVGDINYYQEDDSLVFEMRQNIVDLIMLAESDAKFMLSGISFEQDEATVDFVAAKGWDVTFCGENLKGTDIGGGTRYSVKRNVNTGNNIRIELKKDGVTYAFSAKMVRNTVNLGVIAENGAAKSGIEKREDADMRANDDGSVSVTFKKYELEDPADIVLEQERYFALTEEWFGCPIDELYDVTITFEVETEDSDVDRDFVLRMYMSAGGYDSCYLVDAKTLYANGENKRTFTMTFIVDRLSKKLFGLYESVDRLLWRLDNYESGTDGYRIYEDMTITVKNISYTKYGRMSEQ